MFQHFSITILEKAHTQNIPGLIGGVQYCMRFLSIEQSGTQKGVVTYHHTVIHSIEWIVFEHANSPGIFANNIIDTALPCAVFDPA